MVKVLVVDDSALMRKHLVMLLESDGGFQVRVARNGVEALSLLNSFDPDVITLDINMPEMDGITCLSRIMVEKPKPVVMVSSLTEDGAEATLTALSLGAVDYVHKPDGTISLSMDRVHRELLAKIAAAATARVRRTIGLRDRLIEDRDRAQQQRDAAPRLFRRAAPQISVLFLSASQQVDRAPWKKSCRACRPTFPWAVLVAQHMPGSFTNVFAKRMDSVCAMPVQEVSHAVADPSGRNLHRQRRRRLVVMGRSKAWLASAGAFEQAAFVASECRPARDERRWRRCPRTG